MGDIYIFIGKEYRDRFSFSLYSENLILNDDIFDIQIWEDIISF